VLVDAAKQLPMGATNVIMDSGIENVNGTVDPLFVGKKMRRILAMVDVSYSNSIIEAWWRSLRHQWLYVLRSRGPGARRAIGAKSGGAPAPRSGEQTHSVRGVSQRFGGQRPRVCSMIVLRFPNDLAHTANAAPSFGMLDYAAAVGSRDRARGARRIRACSWYAQHAGWLRAPCQAREF
jgi:hypothetical protein